MTSPGASVRQTGEEQRLRNELAGLRTRLREKNAEVIRLRADVRALACRVALLGEENEQLRQAADSGRLVPLRSKP